MGDYSSRAPYGNDYGVPRFRFYVPSTGNLTILVSSEVNAYVL